MFQFTPNQLNLLFCFLGVILSVIVLMILFTIGAAKIDRQLDDQEYFPDKELQDRLDQCARKEIEREYPPIDHDTLIDLDKKKGI